MKRASVVIFVTIFLFAVAFYTVRQSPETHYPSLDSPALAPETAMNMLYDANLSNFILKPYFTYWVDGSTCKKLRPDCRVLRMESIVEIENRTYLAFFGFQNNTLNLVPTNGMGVKEYLKFFSGHGGRVFPCNSTFNATYSGTSTLRTANGTCVVPAIIREG